MTQYPLIPPSDLLARHGLLISLTADSGHYWPKPGHFRWFFDRLAEQGADLTALPELDFSTKH